MACRSSSPTGPRTSTLWRTIHPYDMARARVSEWPSKLESGHMDPERPWDGSNEEDGWTPSFPKCTKAPTHTLKDSPEQSVGREGQHVYLVPRWAGDQTAEPTTEWEPAALNVSLRLRRTENTGCCSSTCLLLGHLWFCEGDICSHSQTLQFLVSSSPSHSQEDELFSSPSND